MKGKIYGLDLFTGYGGITQALQEWVTPIAYCEIEKYCQGVLLSRMAELLLPTAPIWPDIKTLQGKNIPYPIDIIYGGFPCQGNSFAGVGKGLEDERTGLFFEIVRLSRELRPTFIFLENVMGIRKKSLHTVGWELANIGYDCRWLSLSAEEIGAPHQRKRWFLLAHANSFNLREQQRRISRENGEGEIISGINGPDREMANSNSTGFSEQTAKTAKENYRGIRKETRGTTPPFTQCGGWEAEPNICRVDDGTPFRMDRVKALGNGVVPAQVEKAFKLLMGL